MAMKANEMRPGTGAKCTRDENAPAGPSALLASRVTNQGVALELFLDTKSLQATEARGRSASRKRDTAQRRQESTLKMLKLSSDMFTRFLTMFSQFLQVQTGQVLVLITPKETSLLQETY